MFWGCFGHVLGLFGPPIWPKNLRIRPLGYFFMQNSILKLPDLEIPLKIQKIRKTDFQKNRIFKNRWKIDLNLWTDTVFYAEFESGAENGRKPSQNMIFSIFWKFRFFRKFRKLVKIGSGISFGPILDPESNSAWKTVYIHRFKSICYQKSKIRIFVNSVLYLG